MTPFRNVRYWLSDFRNGGRARTKEEKFNQVHAKLRNVIERSFGSLKRRFPILREMSPYPFSTQRNIVVACVTIHNYLRKIGARDIYFQEFENEDIVVDNPQQEEVFGENMMGESSHGASRQSDRDFMINMREQIKNSF